MLTKRKRCESVDMTAVDAKSHKEGAEEQAGAAASQGTAVVAATPEAADDTTIAAAVAQGMATVAEMPEASDVTTAAQGMTIPAASPSIPIEDCSELLQCATCGEHLRPPLYICRTMDLVRKAGNLYRRSTDLEDLIRLLKVSCPYDGCGGLYSYWEVAGHQRECRYAPRSEPAISAGGEPTRRDYPTM